MLAPASFRIPKQLRDRFDRVVEAGAVNKSKLIRQWIETYTEEKEKEMKIMTKVAEYIEEKHDYPITGESYTVGKVDDGRYFFVWGSEYPKDDEVPAYEIDDGDNGINYHDTADAALTAMQEAVSAVENNKGGTQMLAVISENLIDGGYVLSLHENEGLPAYKTINVETIEEAKKEVEKLNLTWQEPDEDADGDVVLIGR